MFFDDGGDRTLDGDRADGDIGDDKNLAILTVPWYHVKHWTLCKQQNNKQTFFLFLNKDKTTIITITIDNNIIIIIIGTTTGTIEWSGKVT